MRVFDIENELQESLLFESDKCGGFSLLCNIINKREEGNAKLAKAKSQAEKDLAVKLGNTEYVEVSNKFSKLWLIDSGMSADFAVRYNGYKFYLIVGYGMKNFYIPATKGSYEDLKELMLDDDLLSWIYNGLREYQKAGKGHGKKVHDYMNSDKYDLIYSNNTYEIVYMD